jgi:hypothetical protein
MRLATLFTPMAVPLLLASALGCSKKETRTPVAVPSVQAGIATYKSAPGQFTLRYPTDWSSKPTKTYALLLEPEPTSDSARVTVDVPHIPPHLPGMMTMRLVVNGYVDDLKKRLSDFSVIERCDDALAGAGAQRLVITGRERAGERRGAERMLAAVIAIRNEQVYILQADASPETFETARQAMSKIAEDWDWTK